MTGPADGRRNAEALQLWRSRRNRKDRLHREQPRPRTRRALPTASASPTENSASARPGRRSPAARATSGPSTRRRCRNWSIIGTSTRRRPPKCPFRLATSPSRGFLNSSFSENRRLAEAPARPDRADPPRRCGRPRHRRWRQGGDRQSPRQRRTQCRNLRRPAAGRADLAEGIHQNRSHGNGQGINTLIGSDQVPPFGGVAFHDATVWIRPAVTV